MKELNLDRLNSLACIASTVSSIGTGEARKIAGKLLELIETEAAGKIVTSTDDHQWSPEEIDKIVAAHREQASGNQSQTESGDVLIAKTRIDYLERVETDIARLVALIGLHDGSVAINAQAATSALTAEIGELIAKYKA